MSITADTKKKHLKALSLALRHELEGTYDKGEWLAGDLEQRLLGLGVRRERDALPLDEMAHLPDHDKRARKIVDEYLSLRTAADMKRMDAVAEFVRETAYTWANRLLALRCMEARELIDEVILQKDVYGGRSLEHNRLLRSRPELASQDDDGLFQVLEQAFARMAQPLPLLFDPHAPGVALRPSPAALRRCIAMLSGKAPARAQESVDEAVFKESDALGWAYQFWNSEENKRVFAAARTQKTKFAGADIVPATQLYTEPYMVKFLVQNSLGATWLGMHPDSKLVERWEYFVRDADRALTADKDKKALRDLTFLDPACGSGHFLLEAFDLLFDMYQEEGAVTGEAAICRDILSRNLFGIDIDERAVQIAEAALWMKAKERAFDFTAAQTNLVATNLRLPKGKNHLQSFLAKHRDDQPLGPALESILLGLAHADELGSLLQIEEPVEKELRRIKEDEDKQQKAYLGKKQMSLADLGSTRFDPSPQSVLPINVDDWESWRTRTGARLRAHFAEEAEAADLGQRFFNAQASKGWRLFELLGHRYDVVAANPPYMGSKNMGPVLRKYVEQHYSTGRRDLYAAFILRCTELCTTNGRMAMVMPQTWMTGKSYAELRATEEKPTKKAVDFPAGLLRETEIEVLAQLGRHAFSEADPPNNVTMLVLSTTRPHVGHRLACFRISAPRLAEEQAKILREATHGKTAGIFFSPLQCRFLTIPQSPVCYWLYEPFFELLAGTSLGKEASVCQGMSTANDDKYLRFQWETPRSCSLAETKARWRPFAKGVGYRKWYGYQYYCVDWQYKGLRLNESGRAYVRNNDFYFHEGYTYAQMARGRLGFRVLTSREIFSDKSPGIFFKQAKLGVMAILNCRIMSYIARSISPSLDIRESYIARLPLAQQIEAGLFAEIELVCTEIKKEITSTSIIELCFSPGNHFKHAGSILGINYLKKLQAESILHSVECNTEKTLFGLYQLKAEEVESVLSETGIPAGWRPRIANYDTLPSLPDDLARLPPEFGDILAATESKAISPDALRNLKQRLLAAYEAGPGNDAEEDDDTASADDDEEGESLAGAYIPIPAETFLEELSQRLEIHPITIYWLLKEGIEQAGWRCRPEEQRFVTDHFTVKILHLLGHRWPRQIEAGEPVPDWADQDGIIPLTLGTQESSLIERVRARISADFPAGDVSSIEREFAEIMGKPLDRWLESDFFKHHTQQFKKRPIAWQIQSAKFTPKRKPAFACLVYYHKLDGDTLPKLRSQYVGPLRQALETELRTIEAILPDSRSARQQTRNLELQDQLAELRDFDKRLEQVSTIGFTTAKLAELLGPEPLDSFCSSDGHRPSPANQAEFARQEASYLPDLNDGVRVNLAPLQKAGLLAADVLAGKDLDKAIADRATWRTDERRWSREKKLPRPGYWLPPDSENETIAS